MNLLKIKLKIYKGVTWLNNSAFNIGIALSLYLILMLTINFEYESFGQILPYMLCFVAWTATGAFRYLSHEIADTQEYQSNLIFLFTNAYKRTFTFSLIAIFIVFKVIFPDDSFLGRLLFSIILSSIFINYIFLILSVYPNFFSNTINFLSSGK